VPTSDRVARGLSQPAAVRRTAHRVVVTDNTGNLDAPWMVILHGLGGGPSEWAPVVSAFADDYRVLTFAQAGSADADPGPYSPARHCSPLGFADDLGMPIGVARWSASAIPSGRLAPLRSTGDVPHLVEPDELITTIRNFLSGSEQSDTGPSRVSEPVCG